MDELDFYLDKESIDNYINILHIDVNDPYIYDTLFKANNIIVFDVNWIDSHGDAHVNKGYRVQWNNLNGPYKGGLRFHPNVSLELFKKLAFEQTFKNILTGLPMGGAKGGSDFDPHNKSEEDIKLFCIAYMKELYPYIGETLDIPAGDIGVGAKEIEALYFAYLKYSKKYDCALTGKPIYLNGSLGRKEATGYGLCYITEALLKNVLGTTFKDKKVIVSGSGNVAIYAASKAIELGAKVIAMSDSDNAIYDENGIDIDLIKQIKEVNKGRIRDYLLTRKALLYKSKDIFSIPCDICLPCATQNEIGVDEAARLIANHCLVVAEGANLPVTSEAREIFINRGVLFLPGKASNAGGVTVSGFEIIQNKHYEHWSSEEVNNKLKETMENIYNNIASASKKSLRHNDFYFGANYYAYQKLIELANKKRYE